MNIQLFHLWHCPFSRRVRDFIEEHRLENKVEYVELSESPGARERLDALIGHVQVPCLVVEGRPMIDSAEIIQWLQKHLATQPLPVLNHW